MEEIQTEAQIDNGPDHGWFFDLMFPLASTPDFARELMGTVRVVLPEIDAVAQPVIVVMAAPKRLLSRKDPLGNAPVAAVIA